MANNLGGFDEENPAGIPTLILTRIVVQKAANLDEAIRIVRQSPGPSSRLTSSAFTGVTTQVLCLSSFSSCPFVHPE